MFCGSLTVKRTRRGHGTYRRCHRRKSLAKLRREIAIRQGFYQQIPAYRLAHDLGVDSQVMNRVYQKVRTVLFHVAELKGMASKLSGEIELDEADFGGQCKGRRGRDAVGNSVVFQLLERDGRVYTKVVVHVSADPLMAHMKPLTRKGAVSYTDTFRGTNRCGGRAHLTRSITATVWLIVAREITSMESKASGRLPRIFYNYRGYPSITSRCI
ncbi:MAG: transposase [Nitrospira sp.]|nr:MAG: transposase [Nitrospira sp.]